MGKSNEQAIYHESIRYHRFKKTMESTRRKQDKKLSGPTRQEWVRHSKYKDRLAKGIPLQPAQMTDFLTINDKAIKNR